ncbi:MAG: hypothetical protein U0326_13725 [Polyangiales bacterium]
MLRRRARPLVRLLAALAVALACATSYASPSPGVAWQDVIAQTTGGSFGGSSWGTGASSSSSSSSGSSGSSGGSSSSGGGGIVDAIVGLIFQLILELLWQAFVWCLTQYPAPTIAVIAVVALFVGVKNRPARVTAHRDPSEERVVRSDGLTDADAKRIADLSHTMTDVAHAGFALSAALGVVGAITAAMHAGSGALVIAGVAGLVAGLVAAITSWKVLRAVASFRAMMSARDGEVVAVVGGAAEQARALFEWAGGALALVIAALTVAVVVGFCLGA